MTDSIADDLLTTLVAALHSRDPDERADLLSAAITGSAADRFADLATGADSDQILALCLLARSFHRHIALADVAAWLTHPDPQIRAAAVATIALRKADDAVIDAARQGLIDAEPAVRIAAARAIRDNGDPTLLAMLSDLKNDPDPDVRRWAT